MRNILVALIPALTLAALGLCLGDSEKPVFKTEKHMLWTRATDMFGKPLGLPAEIVWAIDPASCDGRVEKLTAGMIEAQKFWSAESGVPIHAALQGESINLVVYCTEFGKFNSRQPLAYRVRSLETGVGGSIERIAVDIPSDWRLNDPADKDEHFSPSSYAAVGVSYTVIGLGLGIKHAYNPGRTTRKPALGSFVKSTTCIKNCDAQAKDT